MFILFEEKRENKEYKGKEQVRWDQQADEGGWGQRGIKENIFCITAVPIDLQWKKEDSCEALYKCIKQSLPQ